MLDSPELPLELYEDVEKLDKPLLVPALDVTGYDVELLPLLAKDFP